MKNSWISVSGFRSNWLRTILIRLVLYQHNNVISDVVTSNIVKKVKFPTLLPSAIQNTRSDQTVRLSNYTQAVGSYLEYQHQCSGDYTQVIGNYD